MAILGSALLGSYAYWPCFSVLVVKDGIHAFSPFFLSTTNKVCRFGSNTFYWTPGADAKDDFQAVRSMWDSYQAHFCATVTASWLLILDESMIKWVGRCMPGLMYVPRKPTPLGAELHTLCCAVCGVMTMFELYEGKVAMMKKEFCSSYAKSTALTLRCTKPYFGSVCPLLWCIHVSRFVSHVLCHVTCID